MVRIPVWDARLRFPIGNYVFRVVLEMVIFVYFPHGGRCQMMLE